VAAEILPLAAGADVDCGSMADGQHSYETFGGKLRLVTASGRDRPWASSSLAAYIVVRKRLRGPSVSMVDGGLGNSVGANGWPRVSHSFPSV
jgi:hypothetical protein